jgi:hypothetical protein
MVAPEAFGTDLCEVEARTRWVARVGARKAAWSRRPQGWHAPFYPRPCPVVCAAANRHSVVGLDEPHPRDSGAVTDVGVDFAAPGPGTAEDCHSLRPNRQGLPDVSIAAVERVPDQHLAYRNSTATEAAQKTKTSADANRLTIVYLGSSTWARTRDLRINRSALERGDVPDSVERVN